MTLEQVGIFDSYTDEIIAFELGDELLIVRIIATKDIAQFPDGNVKTPQKQCFLNVIGLVRHVGQDEARKIR